MLIAIFPLVMFLVGGAIYVFATHPSAKEVGRAMVWAGLFAFAFATASHTLRIG